MAPETAVGPDRRAGKRGLVSIEGVFFYSDPCGSSSSEVMGEINSFYSRNKASSAKKMDSVSVGGSSFKCFLSGLQFSATESATSLGEFSINYTTAPQ